MGRVTKRKATRVEIATAGGVARSKALSPKRRRQIAKKAACARWHKKKGPTMSETTTRATWDEYFLRIAREVSTRATCPRRSVGCVLVRDKKILATGYNGSVRGLAHCTDVGCLMEDGHCVRTVHAEANAIIQAAQSLEGATAYVTSLPCWACFRMLANAGIGRIVYEDSYPNPRIVGTAAQAGIQLVQLVTAEVVRP